MRIFSSSNSPREYRCRDLRGRLAHGDSVDDRQKRVPGFSQEALSETTIAVVGAGGLGGIFVWGAVKKGVGELIIYDGDRTQVSNLSRQFFTPRDIGKNKAIRLARNASRAGFMGTRLVAVPFFFQAAVERKLVRPCRLAFCGVDNDETRAFVARYFRDIPVVFAAVSKDAGYGYVAVQEPGKGCFGCLRPQAFEPAKQASRANSACPVDPAVIDVVGVVSMLALYAIDSLIMSRPRNWTLKQIALHGRFPEINARIQKRPDCPLCGVQGVSL
jgi:molybdopterin/thiamine biosynthesis adenylyltransferase